MNRRSAVRSLLGAMAAPVAMPIAALLGRPAHALPANGTQYVAVTNGRTASSGEVWQDGFEMIEGPSPANPQPGQAWFDGRRYMIQINGDTRVELGL